MIFVEFYKELKTRYEDMNDLLTFDILEDWKNKEIRKLDDNKLWEFKIKTKTYPKK